MTGTAGLRRGRPSRCAPRGTSGAVCGESGSHIAAFTAHRGAQGLLTAGPRRCPWLPGPRHGGGEGGEGPGPGGKDGRQLRVWRQIPGFCPGVQPLQRPRRPRGAARHHGGREAAGRRRRPQRGGVFCPPRNPPARGGGRLAWWVSPRRSSSGATGLEFGRDRRVRQRLPLGDAGTTVVQDTNGPVHPHSHVWASRRVSRQVLCQQGQGTGITQERLEPLP